MESRVAKLRRWVCLASLAGLTIHSSRTRVVAAMLHTADRAGRLNSGVRRQTALGSTALGLALRPTRMHRYFYHRLSSGGLRLIGSGVLAHESWGACASRLDWRSQVTTICAAPRHGALHRQAPTPYPGTPPVTIASLQESLGTQRGTRYRHTSCYA